MYANLLLEGRHRGYGFVEFEEPQDALAAIDNVHMSEYWGCVIKCNLARPTRIFTAGVHTKPGKRNKRIDLNAF